MAEKTDSFRAPTSNKQGGSSLRHHHHHHHHHHHQKATAVPQRSHLEHEAEKEGEALLAKTSATPSHSINGAFSDLRKAAINRYGRELNNVSLSYSAQSQELSESFGAKGVTWGSKIHISPRMHSGLQDTRSTLSHEMVHAVQQTGGVKGDIGISSAPATPALRREQAMGEQWFAVKLNRLNHLLSYRFLDWAITDGEAGEALSLLKGMSSTERATALGSIRVDRLRSNLPQKSQIDQLDAMLKQTEGMRSSVQDINTLLDTHLFDWAVTDAEANKALQRLKNIPTPERHHAVMGINQRVLIQNLDPILQYDFYQMRIEAQSWWNRQRQQHDPLDPGDKVRIYVYSVIAGEFENRYFPQEQIYTISESNQLNLPLIGNVGTRGQRPEGLATHIAGALQSGQFFRNVAASVEVVQRGSEVFATKGFDFNDTQPTDALSPGDTFTLMVIESFKLEEQSDFSINYQIDTGGTVELPFIGRIQVAGKTPEELIVSLQQHFTNWFRQPPTLWVWVVADGEVFRPPQPSDKPQVATRYNIQDSLDARKPLLIPKRRPIDIYLEFYRSKNDALREDRLSTRQRRVGEEALMRYMQWVSSNAGDPDILIANNPWAIYGNFHTPMLIADIRRESRETVDQKRRERESTQHSAMVESKLDEYWDWAMARWKESGVVFRSAGPAHLITEHPYRKIGMDALTRAVLSWAHANTDHPDFARLTANEVALMLMKEDRHLATLVEVGRNARPRLEYFPELDRTRRTLGDTALEVVVGFLPIAGEAQDANDALTGVSITGEKLGTGERVLAGIFFFIPFIPGSALRSGDEVADVIEGVAKTTGRSIDEVEDIFRVAGNLDQTDARQLERIMESVSNSQTLTKTDLDILDGIAGKLRTPLEELAQARKAGGNLPVKPLRVDPVTATRLVPGSSAHMSQRWLEYQVRHGAKYSRLTSNIDPKWQRLYETILANKKAGGKFESDVLGWAATQHHPGLLKNNEMMISSVGDAKGFIPDGVKGNPGELVWGQAYHFLEVKGWKEMSNTGNLKAMINYVDEFGGQIEVVFRSAKHADGATKLSGPLQKTLDSLISQGKATVRRYP
jgi:protein involved in polysaccharide export with SLBB domain